MNIKVVNAGNKDSVGKVKNHSQVMPDRQT